ncbi:hypothetical protein [Caballeronia cordobensis]|uniref:hypothetical protein n=1 Tax=Caballeronia cordobensis TaxID=1353886 RepID=UPI0006AD6875|nr:hypothetical protein [Caballeronia cordobensis]
MKHADATVIRGIPPRADIAWFLGDLLSDEHWREFDMGVAHSHAMLALRNALHAYGGRDAWLRFIETTRRIVPQQLLAVPIVEILERAGARDMPQAPVLMTYKPTLDVYAAGRKLGDGLRLDVLVRLTPADRDAQGAYRLYDTDIDITHEGTSIQRCIARHYLPLPKSTP